jgi:ribosomal-protein-alanine N-acetyltransferase
MLKRDYSDVLAIDSASFSYAMAESELMNILRQKNSIGIVAESSEKILGFAIYDLEKDSIDIVRFAVHPEHRRQGIGTALLDKLISKCHPFSWCFLRQTVSEDNLDGQLFLKARGLKAESISRNEFIDPYSGDGLDGYVFKYSIKQ